MGKLEDLEKELYGADDKQLVNRLRSNILSSGRSKPQLLTSWSEFKTRKNEAPKSPRKIPFKIFWFFGLGAAAVGIAIAVFFYLTDKGQEAEVKIGGQEKIESGEMILLPVVLQNISGVDLADVELSVALPKGSKVLENNREREAPLRLGKKVAGLKSGEERTENFNVRLFGREGEEKDISVSLLYRPSNLKAHFLVKAKKTLTISHVPLAVSWEAPVSVSQGQGVEIKVRYLSDANLPTESMMLRVEYPPGFTFDSSDPKSSSENKVWKIGTLEPGQQGIIIIKGVLNGDPEQVKVFNASLGMIVGDTNEWRAYSEASQEIKIKAAPLAIQGFINGSREVFLSAGEPLEVSLRFRNNTQANLENLNIRVFLEGGPQADSSKLSYEGVRNLVDMNSLSVPNGGIFDSVSKAVVWNPQRADFLRVLGGGAEDEVRFSLSLKDGFAIRSNREKNFVLRLRSEVWTDDVPSELTGKRIKSEDRVDFKLKSKFTFSGKTVYRSNLISNSGANPPKAGQKTTYALTWELRSFNNDLQNVELKGLIPARVNWEGEFYPKGLKVDFDENSRRFSWLVGNVLAGTGVINQALISAFKVSVTPSTEEAKSAIILAKDLVFTAIDGFTGEAIEIKLDNLVNR